MEFINQVEGEREVYTVDSRQFSEEEIHRFRVAFIAVDTDGSGTISLSELQILFNELGYDLSTEEIADIVSKVDVDGSNDLSFNEFMTLLVLVGDAIQKAENQNNVTPDISRFSAEELTEFQEAFDLVDTDHSGTISFSELEEMFRKLEIEVTPDVITNLLQHVDADQSGSLTFDEFIPLVILVREAMNQEVEISDHTRQEAQELFDSVDSDHNGTISTTELGGMFHELGYETTQEELEQLIAMVDEDRSGTLNLDEFITLIVLFARSHKT